MKKKVEIELDVDLVDEAIRRFHLLDAREAVNLALRTLLNNGDSVEQDDEYDEFSDLNAWQPGHRVDGG
ncbi:MULTISPECIES: type II toxin-antitoxin system VapB family antitoxin [Mycobacterium]|uniref:Type II toxin-antitoxin system VapB family antitoxin n=1 Tax=Mycobacterium colombiense TaxID=339268 RepID=A0A329M2Z6_9MYCO|nr:MULTISPECIES: type II toxin-antitoxin system VapB family antitoxin [Mycobacterium]MDM4138839.1 type II toxin-antitoxin system VapB family antitoxin [Mycobacterium sp. FLAC0960]RAV14120.1 type II toxin-antitoxin system VapB family antitoxin [Mycobacterium colombiense]